MSVLALLCADCKAILDTEECATHEVSRVSEFWGQRQVGHFIVGPLCPCCGSDDLKRVQLCACGQVSAEGCAECDRCYQLTAAQETLELAGEAA